MRIIGSMHAQANLNIAQSPLQVDDRSVRSQDRSSGARHACVLRTFRNKGNAFTRVGYSVGYF